MFQNLLRLRLGHVFVSEMIDVAGERAEEHNCNIGMLYPHSVDNGGDISGLLQK